MSATHGNGHTRKKHTTEHKGNRKGPGVTKTRKKSVQLVEEGGGDVTGYTMFCCVQFPKFVREK